MKRDYKFIIAMAIFGSIGIFVKNIDMPSMEIVFLRSVIACICLFGWRIINKNKNDYKINFKENKKNTIFIILSGTTLALNWIFLFQSYKYTTVAVATLSYYTAPIFVIMLSPVLLKEKLTLKRLTAVIVAMIGLALIFSNQSKGAEGNYSHITGIAFGLLAAVFYAGLIIFNKLIKEISGLDRTLIQLFIGSMILLPFILFRNNLHITSAKTGFIILFLGVVHTAIACLLYFSSMEYISAQRISILSYIDPISAVIFGTIFLGEPISIFVIIGGILILVSTLLPQE